MTISTDAESHRVARPAVSTNSPLQWPWALASPPALSSEPCGWDGALLRRWSGTSAVMVQPPLDHHYLVMHLGGAKQVSRRRDGPALSAVAECGSLTLVPAGTAFVWNTSGPIAFAHLYLRPRQIEDAVARAFDVDGRGAWLIDRVGHRDPVLEALFAHMLAQVQACARAGSAAPALRLDALLEGVLIELARRHVSRALAQRVKALALAPHRLARVLDFVEAHLADNIRLADLVAAAGGSQFHFCHAFQSATGRSPYRYLVERRIERARSLLLVGSHTLDDVAVRCGFHSRRQFSVMFKQITGSGPKRYALLRRPCAST